MEDEDDGGTVGDGSEYFAWLNPGSWVLVLRRKEVGEDAVRAVVEDDLTIRERAVEAWREHKVKTLRQEAEAQAEWDAEIALKLQKLMQEVLGLEIEPEKGEIVLGGLRFWVYESAFSDADLYAEPAYDIAEHEDEEWFVEWEQPIDHVKVKGWKDLGWLYQEMEEKGVEVVPPGIEEEYIEAVEAWQEVSTNEYLEWLNRGWEFVAVIEVAGSHDGLAIPGRVLIRREWPTVPAGEDDLDDIPF